MKEASWELLPFDIVPLRNHSFDPALCLEVPSSDFLSIDLVCLSVYFG